MNKSGYRIFSWVLNIAGMAAIFTALYYAVYYSSVLLLEDKKPSVAINEGKYIISTLAEEYENILIEKGRNLDVERIKLLSQIEISKNYKEKMQIEAQLRKVESEKRDFNSELSNSERQKSEIESTLQSTRISLEQTREVIAGLNKRNGELAMQIQAMESISNNYIEALSNYENVKKEEKDVAAKFKDFRSESDKKINSLTLENGRLQELLSEASNLSAKPGMEDFFSYNTDVIYNDPVVYRGKMFTTAKNQLKIFSENGKLVKSEDLANQDFHLTKPAINEGVIYIGSDGGGITACDESGKVLWKEKAGIEAFGASPSASYGIVAVPSIDEGIYIYKKSGEIIAKVSTASPIYSAPMIADLGKKLIFATENEDIIAYDLDKKSEIWKKNYSESYSERILYPLIGDDKRIIFLSSTGRLRALNFTDGSLIWKAEFPEIKNTAINPRYIDGKVILANNSGTSVVIIINSVNGSVETKSQLQNEKIIAPYVSGNAIFFGTSSGNTYSYFLQH